MHAPVCAGTHAAVLLPQLVIFQTEELWEAPLGTPNLL